MIRLPIQTLSHLCGREFTKPKPSKPTVHIVDFEKIRKYKEPKEVELNTFPRYRSKPDDLLEKLYERNRG